METSERVPVSARLRQIMAERGLKQADVLRMVAPFCRAYGEKIGSNTLSEWVAGKYEPNNRKITILAMALNVSEGWLMGYDEFSKERQTPVPVPHYPVRVITDDDIRLLDAYHANPAAQVYINRMLGLPDPKGAEE